MKKVHNTSMVAHLWAHQSQSEARNGRGSVFFHDDTIYSYGHHFPIARHVDGVVLFNSGSYSVTTSGHQSIVRQAASHLKTFTVPDVLARSEGQHKANMANYRERYERQLLGAGRARKAYSIEWQLRQAEETRTEANEYAERFGIDSRIEAVDVETMRVKAKELAVKQAAETRRKNEERRKAYEAETEQYRLELDKWRRGERDRPPHLSWGNPARSNGAALRVRGDTVETSQGATVPASHAAAAWPVIKACRDKGRTFQTNGRVIRLGHFRLDSVDAKGNVKAGCHYIPFVECERVAVELGL